MTRSINIQKGSKCFDFMGNTTFKNFQKWEMFRVAFQTACLTYLLVDLVQQSLECMTTIQQASPNCVLPLNITHTVHYTFITWPFTPRRKISSPNRHEKWARRQKPQTAFRIRPFEVNLDGYQDPWLTGQLVELNVFWDIVWQYSWNAAT